MRLSLLVLFIIGCTAQCSVCTGCGNGKCEYPAESCASCPSDCGPCPPCNLLCGNFRCDADKGETSCNCPQDCGVCCEDGICRQDKGETFYNCPSDCSEDIHGVVVDAQTLAPLTNIDVRCFSRDRSYPVINTGAGNAFRINDVPPDTYTCLAIDAAGVYGSAYTNITLDGRLQNTTIVIPLPFQYCSIMGVTYDATNDDAVGGANINCVSPSTGNRWTSPMGLYFFVNVVPGVYTCTATKEKYRTNSCQVSCTPGNAVECDIELEPLPGTVIGKVYDVTTGQSIVATVNCTFADGVTAVRTSNTSTTTSYEFTEPDTIIIPGKVKCFAERPLYKTLEVAPYPTVGKGETIRIDFPLQPLPATISGQMTDSVTDLPVNLGAHEPRVTCSYMTKEGRIREVRETPLDTGFFSLQSLDPGNYTCVCSARLYYSSVPYLQVVTAGQNYIFNCEVDPIPAFVTVRTQRPNGQPVVGASIDCTLPGSQAHPSNPASSDASGIFVFGDITNYGNTSCSGSLTGYSSDTKTTITQIGRNNTITLILRPTFLEVFTLDGEALPLSLEDVNVVISNGPPGCPDRTAITTTKNFVDASTFPDFDVVCEGTWTITASKNLYVSNVTTVTLVAGTLTEVELILSPQLFPIDILVTSDNLRYPNGTITFTGCPNGANYDGALVDSNGNPGTCAPISGANVDIWRTSGRICSQQDFFRPSTLVPSCKLYSLLSGDPTSPEPGFVTPLLIPDRNYYLNVTRSGYAPTVGVLPFPYANFIGGQPQKHIKLSGTSANVEGCIVDQFGAAIRNGVITLDDISVIPAATVKFVGSDDLLNQCGASDPACAALKGCFEFDFVKLQRQFNGYRITVTSTDGTIISSSYTISVIEAGTTVDADASVIQSTTGTLIGRVVSSVLTSGVEGATVTCVGQTSYAAGQSRSALTLADGTFSFTEISIGNWNCSYAKTDFRSSGTNVINVGVNTVSDLGTITLISPVLTILGGDIFDGCGRPYGAPPTYDEFSAAFNAQFQCYIWDAKADGSYDGVHNSVINAGDPPSPSCAAPCVDYTSEPSAQLNGTLWSPSKGKLFSGLSRTFVVPANKDAPLFYIECLRILTQALSSENWDTPIREWDASAGAEVTPVPVYALAVEALSYNDLQPDTDPFDRTYDFDFTLTGFEGEVTTCT